MASALQKSTMIFRESVNTPEFDNDEWIINPDLSAVIGVPRKYWKLVENEIVEMTAEEKAIVDQPTSKEKVNAAIEFGKDLILEFGSGNVEASVPLEITKAITKELEPITIALMTGTVTVALDEMKKLDSVYIDDMTKAYFIAKMQAFIESRNGPAGVQSSGTKTT